MAKIKDMITILDRNSTFDYHTIEELKEIILALEQIKKIKPIMEERHTNQGWKFKEFELTIYKDRPFEGKRTYALHDLSEEGSILNRRYYEMRKGKLVEIAEKT